MMDILGVKPGSVNLFSIIKDSEDKVKLVVDKKVHEAQNIGVHPMENSATVRISNDLLQYVITYSNHEAEIVDFEALSADILKQEEEKKS